MNDDNDTLDDFFSSQEDHDSCKFDANNMASKILPPRLGMLADLNDDEFNYVVRSAKLTFLECGDVVFRQGDSADRFYIVIDGELELVRDGSFLAKIKEGMFFGESALLVGGLRSATVTATVNTSLWSVAFDAFKNAMSHHLLASEIHGPEASQRILDTPLSAFERPNE